MATHSNVAAPVVSEARGNPLAAWFARHPHVKQRMMAAALACGEAPVSRWCKADEHGAGVLPTDFAGRIQTYTRDLDPADFVSLDAWEPLRQARAERRRGAL